MPSVPMNLANHPTHVVLDLGCTRSIGSRTAIKRFQETCVVIWHHDRILTLQQVSLCLPILRRKLFGKLYYSHSDTPPCSTRVDVLEKGKVPILFSLSKMKNSGMEIELDPKGDKITCPAFGLYSSPAEYSTMGHIVLDLTSLAYQTKIA